MKASKSIHKVPTIRKIAVHPTVEMDRVELDVMLSIDAAFAKRDAVFTHPTVQMEAVKVLA